MPRFRSSTSGCSRRARRTVCLPPASRNRGAGCRGTSCRSCRSCSAARRSAGGVSGRIGRTSCRIGCGWCTSCRDVGGPGVACGSRRRTNRCARSTGRWRSGGCGPRRRAPAPRRGGSASPSCCRPGRAPRVFGSPGASQFDRDRSPGSSCRTSRSRSWCLRGEREAFVSPPRSRHPHPLIGVEVLAGLNFLYESK